MYYVLDTNIWLELTRGKVSCADLSGKAHLKETVKHKGKYFENDKHVFQCMAKFDVLPLTKVFILSLPRTPFFPDLATTSFAVSLRSSEFSAKPR
jgi:hypothetical protein